MNKTRPFSQPIGQTSGDGGPVQAKNFFIKAEPIRISEIVIAAHDPARDVHPRS